MRFRWLSSLLFPLALATMAAAPVRAQCTPVNCLGTLPPQGGVCASAFAQATLAGAFADAVSFHTTTNCFDAGEISPPSAGTQVRIKSTHDFTFTGLPAGLTGATNQASYTAPANGCIALSGTPTEAGIFDVTVNLLADLSVTSNACVPILAWNDNAMSYTVRLTVQPDASFSIPATTFTACQAPVALTPSGTQGGTFSGPGVSGSTFDPSMAGPGEHTITYSVSAQQGAAMEAAQAESALVVTVVGATLSLSSTPATCTTNDGSATVTPSGGTPPFTSLWSNGVTSATNANLAAGSYSVTVTDAAGCTTQGMVEVAGPSSCGSPDAGTTDMGVLVDAGVELDAGSVADVGVARDLGATPDAGSVGGGGCAVGGDDAHHGGMWLALAWLVSGLTRSRVSRGRGRSTRDAN